LWEIEEAGSLRYRCHVGHAYAPASLLVEQDDAVEQSIFVALRAVEEKATSLRRLANRWPDALSEIKADYEKRARELDTAASTLKDVLAGTAR
jgi:two-component system chemotaxis response regulator CheB